MHIRHKWKTNAAVEVMINHYGTDRLKRYETHISQECVECGVPRLKKVEGIWYPK